MRQFVTLGLAVVVACGIALTTGCESDAGNTALLGTAIGAGVGALAGGNTEGALIGGAVGGGAGYMIGNESDKKKTQSEIASVRAEQNNVTVWITNSNGSQVPVRLRRDGPGYIGPRGERYPTLPTEAQLKPVYGF
ncbi:MAG: hypothetical protein J7M40_04350 [Planctomycetes bacterium]|nr:hypothetical protein [Planctomycetota bacterium]